ncbi:transglutaminase domain-containing protein, partial [Candidatus Woesearchaeota archaeon]|nr:transglutaminase domain-containing protein [Candidatus Woesearchaeota archaeon]
MLKRVIFLFLLLLPLAIADPAQDFNGYSSIKVRYTSSSSFSLQPQGQNARADFVVANLTFFPREEPKVSITSIRYLSEPSIGVVPSSDVLTFNWYQPKATHFIYGVDALIEEKNVLLPIDQKISFPIQPVETYYTQPSEYIDFDDAIQQKAQELAVGEDDLYVVTFHVADWVAKNVKYDLTTLTAEVVQKSTWVFQNREGVCDELTNLFISMMRSLHVPARFVSGMAYTNLGYKWVPHAWAEVYFPDKGWVPFDIAFGEFGWVDPGHVKLKVSLDSGEASVKYLWKTYNMNFNSSAVDLQTTLVETGTPLKPLIGLSLKPLVNRVGSGSYVPFEVDVQNTHSYYFPETIIVLKSNELNESNVKRVLLKPQSSQRLFWIMHVPENLDKNFLYTSVIEAEDAFHTKTQANVTYADEYPIYSKTEAEAMVAG